jgi:hypothetical protein
MGIFVFVLLVLNHCHSLVRLLDGTAVHYKEGRLLEGTNQQCHGDQLLWRNKNNILDYVSVPRIPLQAYKYQPSGERDIDRPRRRWRDRTILEAGTGESSNT